MSMSRGRGTRIRWTAVAGGWVAALLAGIVISGVLRLIFGGLAEPRPGPRGFTGTVIVLSLLAGFLAYAAGGYVAGRLAPAAGALHGALTAVFGLVVGIIAGIVLAIAGAVFTDGRAMPPPSFGLAGGAFLAGFMLFLINLLGGYLGGKWGGGRASST